MQTISRRRFIEGSAALSLATHPWAAAFAKGLGKHQKLLLVGTQTGRSSTSKGIYAYAFDTSNGDLKQLGVAVESESPTFFVISPDGKYVYSVNEVGHYEGKAGGAVSSFSFDRKNEKLTPINIQSSVGGGPTHIAVDHTGRCVFAANYGGGSVVSFAVNGQGHLSEAVSFVQYEPDASRHERHPHAHWVTLSPDNRFLLVNDLGLDQIHIHRLDASTAKLTLNDPPRWRSGVGYGPRALAFHPNGKWAYCVNELKPRVCVLNWDAQKGELTTAQDISLEPEDYTGRSAPADIVFDKHMRFGYVASRLDDFMATFSISPTNGTLTPINHTPCGGKRPRHLALDPSDGWLLLANQDTDNIAVFARDKRTGHLAETFKSFPIAKPQCLVFV
jgi:6-phosphogluconolactonase